MANPSAIIFINSDINDGIKNKLISQLMITETMTGQEFDSRVVADPNYPQIIHANYLRILIIRDSFRDLTNRTLADIVMFFKQGIISIEKNNFGPPGLRYQIDRINIYDLLRYNNSSHVKILPATASQPCACVTTCNCGLGGIFAIESRDTSGITCPNTDNLSHNTDFINRK
tara:strand:- start:9904 stop:10419 length:516 start_codon:yes stop_codon:yes gene_type:complete